MRRLAAAIVMTCGAAVGFAHAAERLPLAPAPGQALAPSADEYDDSIDALLSKSAPINDAAAVNWTSNELRFTPQAALRIRVGDPPAGPGGGGHNLRAPGFTGAQNYELSVVRDWPGAVSFNTNRFGVDFTPHAGVGVTSTGGLAEAGATLQFRDRVDSVVKSRLGAMGVRDGSSLGGRGRWYLFAAASGRSVGLNMLRNDAGWDRAGWTTDQASTLVGDAQLGVGWRKGAMQTSLGFLHREMKNNHTIYGLDVPKSDSLVAFSFAVRPRR
jgi:hypothetical protein